MPAFVPRRLAVSLALARDLSRAIDLYYLFLHNEDNNMKKGLHPQMQWISYVTKSGRLLNIMMTKIHTQGKVYHLRAKGEMSQSAGQIAKFNRRYGLGQDEGASSK